MNRVPLTSLLTGVLVCFLALLPSAGRARVIRVSQSSAGPVRDGVSWPTAFLTVQAGLNAAEAGDEVWVAAATYNESLSLPSSVSLYGGFSGTEAARDEREPARNTTILQWDRSGAVVTSENGAAGTHIDGFTIRCPLGTPSSITGIVCRGSTLTIANNTIVGFRTSQFGGAVSCTSGGVPMIHNNRFVGNRAALGGAIYCLQADAMIMNNTFIGNAATGSGNGGAIYCDGTPRIDQNVFIGNTAGGYGGALSARRHTGRVVNNTFVSNRAAEGGAMSFGSGSTPLLANNIVAFNSSGVYREPTGVSAPGFLSNCLYGNDAYNVSGYPDPIGVGDNIAADPLLAAFADGNVHIQPGSPCVDAGSPTFVISGARDMDGQPREQGARVDIGADESNGATWPAGPLVVRVSPDGDDANNGLSWGAAKRTVGAALRAVEGASGGEVWVRAGVYAERITVPLFTRLYGGFHGTETERVQRDTEANETVLDGGRGGSVVVFTPGGSQDMELDGFTIRNGSGTRSGVTNGGGILISGASPVIRNNIVEGNFAYRGSGVYCLDGSPLIERNVFRENGGPDYYGAVCLQGEGAPVVRNNEITLNATAGIFLSSGGPRPLVRNNAIIRNAGSGIHCVVSADIVGNTIAGNGADGEGGGIDIWSTAKDVRVANNIVAFNASGVFAGSVPPETQGAARTFQNNCVYGNLAYDYRDMPDPTGTDGNIAADPLLVRLGTGDIHIQPDSPCRDAGDDASADPEAPDLDGEGRVQGARVDIGVDESDGTAWPVPPARIVRVATSGSDDNDGSSWGLAKRTVQAAVNAVADGGGTGEVWVAAGTYTERVTLAPDVAVYGGFAGGEAAREERDWHANASVLDGGRVASVVTIPAGRGLTTVVDGLTIRNGFSTLIKDPDGVTRGYGGGILCTGALPTIRHNTITANAGEAGIHGAGLFADNVIDGNACGGIHLVSGAVLRNTITRNSDQAGAGIFCGSSALIAGNVIAENAGNMTIGAGGGIYAVNESAIITNNAVFGNSSYEGGGLYCSSSAPIVANNAVWSNTAVLGSAMVVGFNEARVVNNTIVGNTIVGGAEGSAVLFDTPRKIPAPPAVFANNIVAFNSSGIEMVAGAVVDFRSNCVFGNGAHDYLPVAGFVDPTGTNGNISADPMLAAVPTDLRLRAGSPCVDAGDDAALEPGWTDLDGEPRVVGAAVDIGAYELAAPPYELSDVVRALMITAGLSAAGLPDMARLDVAAGGSPGADVLDAALLARRAAGLDAGR